MGLVMTSGLRAAVMQLNPTPLPSSPSSSNADVVKGFTECDPLQNLCICTASEFSFLAQVFTIESIHLLPLPLCPLSTSSRSYGPVFCN